MEGIKFTQPQIIEKEQPVLSYEKKEKISEILRKLKEVLKRENISPKVKDLLIDAEVIGVITGFKPASYIQPKMEKKTFGFLTEREGISQKDLKQFKDILAEFEVDFKIKDDKEDPVLEKETGIQRKIRY